MRKKGILLSAMIMVALSATIQLASATSGEAILELYELVDGSYQPVDTDEQGKYMVYPGQIVYIRLEGIESELGDYVQVRISYKDPITGEATDLGIWPVLVEDTTVRYVGYPTQNINWTVPGDATVCNTYVVQYRRATATDPIPSAVYVASSPLIGRRGHLHIVPEYPIGTLGTIMVLLASFGIYQLTKSRKAILVPNP